MRTGHPLPENDVAVVGAGIVGVACAYTLARSGLRVLLLDRQEPGQGASFGNAGHLATEQVFPIADLSILRRLPAMLSDPLGPLRLNWRYAPRALPWFMRLLLNLRPAPLQKTIAGLRALNERSLHAWLALLEAIGRPGLFRRDGSLLVYERPDSLPAVQALQARLRGQGVTVDAWQAGAVRDAAPRLHEQLQGGLFFQIRGTSSTRIAWCVSCFRRRLNGGRDSCAGACRGAASRKKGCHWRRTMGRFMRVRY